MERKIDEILASQQRMINRIGKGAQNLISDQEIRISYSVLNYFGFESLEVPYACEVDVQCQSLLRLTAHNDCAPTVLISEVYTPENALQIMQQYTPELIDQYQTDLHIE